MELEHHPYAVDASHTTLSPSYVADTDPKEDPIDYVVDADDDEEEEEESSENDDELHALPTPPPSSLTLLSSPLPQIPPPTSPTYAQAPLGYRAAIIRAASPPTHHPLPLPAPSTSHRADIPEADKPPRKRLLLTAPTPRFEVGESFAIAAAIHPGSIVARRVEYNFMDTVDASIRASKRRTMAAIEDDQEDRAALRDEVDTLRRALEAWITVLETQAIATSGSVRTPMIIRLKPSCVSRHWRLEQKMPPKKRTATTTTTIPMTDAQIKALIAQGIADALAKRDADRSMNSDDSHDSGSDEEGKCLLLKSVPTVTSSNVNP
ncbi:hypothetical protein Tco_1451708 [Tanacetum coccineum]